jgi:membrane protein YdbS with pleckstrin-like domain
MTFFIVSTLLLIFISLVVLFVMARRERRYVHVAMERYPEHPWKWREDWAQGYIYGGNIINVVTRLLAALIFLLLTTPILFNNLETFLDSYVNLLLLFFFFIGVYLLVLATYQLAQLYLFHGARLTFSQLPISVGKKTQAMLLIPAKMDGDIRYKLIYKRVDVSKSTSKHTAYTPVWEENYFCQNVSSVPGTTLLNLEFYIPAKLPSSFEQPYNHHSPDHIWELEIHGYILGIDYSDIFALPVIQVDEDSIKDGGGPQKVADDKLKLMTEVHFRDSVFYIRPLRKFRFTFLGIFFSLILISFGVFFVQLLMEARHSMMYFFLTIPTIFLLGGVFILFISMKMALSSINISIHGNDIIINTKTLGVTSIQEIPLLKVKTIEVYRGAFAGGINYYHMKVLTQDDEIKIPLMLTLESEADLVANYLLNLKNKNAHH